MKEKTTIGMRIAKARKDANMKQVEVAEKLKVSFQAVSSWERDEFVPDTWNLIELAKVLDVSVSSLVEDRNGETFRIPAFSGHEIIDTTGAGDVFHGGFLFAHSQGWDLRTCAVYASAVSFIKCTALGGRVGIPSRNTVEQFLKDGTIDRTDTELRMEHYRSVMRFE